MLDGDAPGSAPRRATEARYRCLMEQGPDAIFVLTPEGVIEETNRRVGELLGFAPEPLLGRDFRDLVIESERQYIGVQFQRLREDGSASASDVTLLREGEGTLTIDLSMAMVQSEDGASVLAIVRDATARHLLERQTLQQDKLAALGTLAAGVAHEVSNPTGFVLASLAQLKTSSVTLQRVSSALRRCVQGPDGTLALAELDRQLAEVSDLVRRATEGTERVRDIVRDLKNLARMDDGDVSRVRVHQCLDTAIGMVLHEIRAKARVERVYSPELPDLVANPGRLHQVFSNLLTNAAQAMPEGHADENVVRVSTSLEGNRIRIEVRDTGRGIPPEVLPRIFDPFFTTKTVGMGTGLGLSICQDIVHRMGGEIRVESVVDEGSTVTVMLPLRASRSIPPTVVAREIAGARRARLLVVDDEPNYLFTYQAMLKPSHEVTTALGGRAALELLALPDRHFDAIVCDLAMADVDGIDLYRYIAEKLPGTEQRMIFVTGGPTTERAVEFLAEVRNHRLDKPFEPEELMHALQSVVARSTTSMIPPSMLPPPK